LPLVPGGMFAAGLSSSRTAALALAQRLSESLRWIVPFSPELDIVVWAPRAKSASEASRRSQRIFEQTAANDLHLALIQLPLRYFSQSEFEADQDHILCLRSVLMKPEHELWVDEIVNRLNRTD
jgi:tyrosine decarboxylase/aspartate 1-decarboxylase